MTDLITLEGEDPRQQDQITLHHPLDETKKRVINKEDCSRIELILQDIFCNGELQTEFPGLEELRKARDADLAALDPGVKRLMNPHIYHVSLSQALWQLKQKLMKQYSC